MAFQFNAVRTALLGALAAIVVAPSTFAQSANPERLERVEVTGSNIKRTDTETVAPVEIITREQILRTGRPTIAEVLRALPINSGGSFNEQNANSFSPGSSGVSLRGLGQKATLVLLNGRRVAVAGFAQSISDTFVDLNTIPVSAIDRVEILKDGASAIYGSDAIAGVVNIIFRKDFEGLEATIGGGRSEGKNEYRGVFAAGFGDLSRDKFNVFASIDLYKRDLLELSDTEFGKTRDYRGQQGGRNLQSLTGGGTWQQYTPNGTTTPVATQNFRAISGCQGTVLNGPQAVAAGLINLSTNQSAATLATNNARAAASNTYCTYDFNSQFTTLPETERIGFQTRANWQITPSTLAYLDVGLARITTKQTFQDSFFAGNVGFVPTAQGLIPYPFNITFNPGVSGNPFPTIARFNGVQTGLGTKDSKIVSDNGRFVAGVSYEVFGFDGDSAIGLSRNNSKNEQLNRATASATARTLGVTLAIQPPIPTSTFASYNLDNPGANSQALNNSILTNFTRKSRSQDEFIDTRLSREIQQLRLPGGPIAIGFGGELRKDLLQDRPPLAVTSGDILGTGSTASDGSRRSYAAYVELDLPFFKELEGQVAGRFDHFSDYGNSKTPKFGLKYKPSDAFLLRGNYGRGFRAPSLPEITKTSSTSFSTVVDPEDGLSHQITGVQVANPNLQAEHSISSTVGFVLEPNKSFNTSVDVYRIRWRNVVGTQSILGILQASCPRGGPGCPSTPQVLRDPTTNALISVLSGFINVSERRTVGVDWEATYTLPLTEFGKFALRTNVNYIHSYTENGVECVGHQVCTFDIPRVKGIIGIDYDYGPVSVTGAMNYTHQIARDFAPANAFVDTNDPRFQNGALQPKAPAYRTYDLTGRYVLTKNFTLNAGIVNIFNQLPPYDSAFTNVYDSSLYDVRGRQYRASLSYKM